VTATAIDFHVHLATPERVRAGPAPQVGLADLLPRESDHSPAMRETSVASTF
jgi:hypothetical protein